VSTVSAAHCERGQHFEQWCVWFQLVSNRDVASRSYIGPITERFGPITERCQEDRNSYGRSQREAQPTRPNQ
jgi:hypothetical protein